MAPLAESCARAREWACRRLDGELSDFEGALLCAHVGRCTDCREFARSIAAITGIVRDAEPARPPRPFVMQRHRRFPRSNAVLTAAAVVAVCVTGVTLVTSVDVSRNLPTGAAVSVDAGAVGSDADLPLLRQHRVAQLVPSAIRAANVPSRGLQLR